MTFGDFQGLKLSALGLGCMRLPKSGPADEDIDVAATLELHRLRCLRVRLPAGYRHSRYHDRLRGAPGGLLRAGRWGSVGVRQKRSKKSLRHRDALGYYIPC